MTPPASAPASAAVLLNRLLSRGKFRHLQVLLRVAELGSVQRAADAIGVTQSSVTQTLAYLEALVEAPLFRRHARGVTPTPVCVDLLPVARQVLKGLAEGADVLQARQRRGGGTVRLLASLAGVHGLLLDALPTFHEQHAGVQVTLREAEGEDQLLALVRGEVDLVVCRRPAVVPEGWVFEALLEDCFVIACAPDHPLLRRRRVSWALLGRQTWLLAPAETAARRRFEEIAQHFDGPPATHPLLTRVFSATLATVQQAGVLSLLPQAFVHHPVRAGLLASLPAPTALPMAPIGLMRPSATLGESAQGLYEFLLRWSQASSMMHKA